MIPVYMFKQGLTGQSICMYIGVTNYNLLDFTGGQNLLAAVQAF